MISGYYAGQISLFRVRVTKSRIPADSFSGVFPSCLFMKKDPFSHLRSLIGKYTVISFIPDTEHYRRIEGDKPGRCIFRGCTEPVAWEDARGGNFLCEGQYQTMKQWIEDARGGNFLCEGHYQTMKQWIEDARGGTDIGPELRTLRRWRWRVPENP